jgi:hypothetical protein
MNGSGISGSAQHNAGNVKNLSNIAVAAEFPAVEPTFCPLTSKLRHLSHFLLANLRQLSQHDHINHTESR